MRCVEGRREQGTLHGVCVGRGGGNRELLHVVCVCGGGELRLLHGVCVGEEGNRDLLHEVCVCRGRRGIGNCFMWCVCGGNRELLRVVCVFVQGTAS